VTTSQRGAASWGLGVIIGVIISSSLASRWSSGSSPHIDAPQLPGCFRSFRPRTRKLI
jgi:hypothetical protein